jgi:hypothetical protein
MERKLRENMIRIVKWQFLKEFKHKLFEEAKEKNRNRLALEAFIKFKYILVWIKKIQACFLLKKWKVLTIFKGLYIGI